MITAPYKCFTYTDSLTHSVTHSLTYLLKYSRIPPKLRPATSNTDFDTHSVGCSMQTARTGVSFIFCHQSVLVTQNARNSILAVASPQITEELRAWLRGTVVERRSVTGKLSLSYARPAVDG